MNRQELIKKAIELATSDMQNIGVAYDELLEEANKLTDEELTDFIEGN